MTGGTGFLGKTLLDYCGESASVHGQHFHLTVMSRSPEQFLRTAPQYDGIGWLSFVRGDVASFPAPLHGVTDVIHAAANTHSVLDGMTWIDQIVGGARCALRWAVDSGARRFLLMSSGAIYGPQPPDVARMQETFGGAPATTAASSVYGQAKRLAEQLCTIYAATSTLQTIIARCFAFTGPHVPLDGPYAMGNFIRDALWADCIRVRGDGSAVRTYLYGRDMARWIMTLLLRGRSGEAYNVGSDQPINMAGLAAAVALQLCPGKPVVVENALEDSGARSVYVPDIAKAQQLGLSVETPLAQAIKLSAQGSVRPLNH